MAALPVRPASRGRSARAAGSRGRSARLSHGGPAGQRGHPQPALVGRADELAQLLLAVTQPPAVVIVEGEAGIGKTRLVAELRGHPELAGRPMLVGGCRAIREPFPLGPVLDALRDARLWLDPAALSPVTGALRPLLPELADLLPAAPEPLHEPVAERHRVFRGLNELLVAVGPVTLVLEDLHWADPQTMDFLRYVLADPPGDLSLVVSWRDEEASASVRAFASRLPAGLTRRLISLKPLDARQTGQLAAVVATEPVSDDFARYLRECTDGLPFAIEQLMALLRDRGLAPPGGRWSRRQLDEFAVPAAVRDQVQERVRLLSEPARSMLEALAVFEQPATEPLIAAVSGHSTAAVAAGLSQGIASGLLVDTGDAVGFRHTLAARAVYDGLAGPMRRQLHSRVAAALADLPTRPLGQIAHHLQRSGQTAAWVAVAEAAADQAVALGNHDEAARMLAEILRHGVPEAGTAGRVAVKLGWSATEALQALPVDDLLAEVLAQDLDRPTRGELAYLLAVLLDQVGREPERVRALLRRAAGDATGRPELRARALVSLALRSDPEESLARRKRWLDRAVGLLPAVADPPAELFLLGKAGSALVFMGHPQWREVAQRIRDRTQGRPRTRHQGNAWYSVGSAAVLAGHLREADDLLVGALDGAVATRDQRLEAFTRAALTSLDYHRGQWAGLPQTASMLIEQLGSYPACRQLARAIAGSLAVAQGEYDRAVDQLTPLAEQRAPGSYSVTLAAAALMRLRVAHGDPAAALATAQAFLADHGPRVALQPVFFRALPWLVEALLAGDRPAQAGAVLARCARELRRADAPLAPAALPHTRGLLALAGGDPAGAADHLLLAAQRYHEALCPYEAALAREQAAHALGTAGAAAGGGSAGGTPAAGAPAALAEPLRAALAAYERLGATGDLARAARLARRYGVPVPAGRQRARGYGSQMSPRERQVAELVATGRSNGQIARQLDLSAETVKKHLQAVMRKLQVPTRAAVAGALRGAVEADR